jgi:hypothetical protein
MPRGPGGRAAIGRRVACGAAALVAPVIGLLACSSSTQGARDAGAQTDGAADRAADLASATDATDAADASDARPNLGGYPCVNEPGDGGIYPDASTDVSHRCEANESFCMIQSLPPGAGGGATGHCQLFDVADAAAACALHPTCACASTSRLANCTCEEFSNTVTVHCGPV